MSDVPGNVNVLIIEDETPAVKRLEQLINKHRPEINIVATHDSIERSVKWLQENPKPSLIFMDVQLADGLSFEIFNELDLDIPIIFTTAYQQYALKAFKVNSIDYLLKPIDDGELVAALDKFYHLRRNGLESGLGQIQQLIVGMNRSNFKERFLVKTGQQLLYISAGSIRYFYSENGLVNLRTESNKKHIVDYTLEQLEEMLSPRYFFRINRKSIIHLDSIGKIKTYFNSRLKLELIPNPEFEVIVSRDRVNNFKSWLDN